MVDYGYITIPKEVWLDLHIVSSSIVVRQEVGIIEPISQVVMGPSTPLIDPQEVGLTIHI